MIRSPLPLALLLGVAALLSALPARAKTQTNTGKALDVAAIYFPSWHTDDHYSAWFGENWNEWTLLKNNKEWYPGHRTNQPAWGYFDEADPRWMERQIDVAADNGISVFIFDWYWYNGVQILNRPVEETLPKTPNKNRIKYALMWADHTWTDFFPAPYNKPYHWLLPIRHSAADFHRVMDFCIHHHFNQPNYWRVNGGAYFSIFAPEDFIHQLGGPEKTKAVLDDARRQVAKAGLGKMHFAAFTGIESSVKLCEDAGFDSLTSYNVTTMSAPLRLPEQPFEEYDSMIERHLPYWNMMDTGKIVYDPVVTAGWDVTPRWSADTPWPPQVNNYPYTPIVVNNTPEKFGKLVGMARDWVQKNPKHPPAIFVNSWNEWTEGGAIMPGTLHGYDYLKELNKAVASAESK
jgi:hypothetical protein